MYRIPQQSKRNKYLGTFFNATLNSSLNTDKFVHAI
jgi:hypothetical protein